jgi:hypothetical protein
VALVPEPLPLSFPLAPELLPVVLIVPDAPPLVTEPLALMPVPPAPEPDPETFVVPEVVLPVTFPAPELLPVPPGLLPDSPPGNVAGEELHAAKRQPVPRERAAIAKLARSEVVIEFSFGAQSRSRTRASDHYAGWPVNVTEGCAPAENDVARAFATE